MAIALPFELARLQGLRAVLSTLINFAAAIVFLVRGHLVVWAVVTLLVGTVTGGWIETWLIQRLSPRVVRGLVVVIAVATPIRLA